MFKLFSMNRGPLSDVDLSGFPCLANMISNFGSTTIAAVDETISTSGYLEYESITVNRYSAL